MNRKLGERLKKQRKLKQEKQRDVADFLNVTERHYRNCEAGKVDLPSSKLLMLADHFDVSTDYLLGRIDSSSSNEFLEENILQSNRMCQVDREKNIPSLGKRLQECRKKKGFTQKQAAEYFKVTEQHWQKYEAGQKTPTYSGFLELADFFGVSLDYLAGRTDA